MDAFDVSKDNKDLQRVVLRFPNATAVSVMGEFNNWSNIETPLTPLAQDLWELHVKDETHLRQLRFFVWDHGMLCGRMVADPCLVRVVEIDQTDTAGERLNDLHLPG